MSASHLSPTPASPIRRVWRLDLEIGFVAAVIVAWQAARIPLEGSESEAFAHARSWLRAERALHVDVEDELIRAVHAAGLSGVVDFLYSNLHLVGIGVFLLAARLLAAHAYPAIRTTFVLAHLPALAVLGVFPLAPPEWLPEMPYAKGPPEGGLTGSFGDDLRNSTAAAVSLHFGYALLAGVATWWLARHRTRLAPLAFLWPLLVLFVIVGNGNHYVLDALVGAACMTLAAVAAYALHRRKPQLQWAP